MSSDWPLVSVDDIKANRPSSIAIGPFGSRMKSDCYVSEGVRVVRGTNLTGGRSVSGDFVFITPEKADELTSANLLPNDLVFPHRGAIGEVGIVPNDGERYVLSSSLMKLTCSASRAHPDFIYYFFKSEAGRFELLKNASQVGTPGIGQPLASLKQIKLRLPPVDVQRSISAALRALDDRIALLRETNATLEAIAQALFKSWFVDFDPVRAKQQGLAPAGMDEATAALFPASFEESALGLAPMGWKFRALDEIATYLNGLALQKFPPSDDSWLPVIKIAQLRKGDTVGADRAGHRFGIEVLQLRIFMHPTTDEGGVAQHVGVGPRHLRGEVGAQAEEFLGRIDILVNNAGILGPVVDTVGLDDAGYHAVCQVNQHAVFYGMRAILPAMLRAGKGSIVNISSIAGMAAPTGSPNLAYVASKFAVRGMSKAAAMEYGKHNLSLIHI